MPKLQKQNEIPLLKMSYFLLEKNIYGKMNVTVQGFLFIHSATRNFNLIPWTELLYIFRKDYVQNWKSSPYSNNNS